MDLRKETTKEAFERFREELNAQKILIIKFTREKKEELAKILEKEIENTFKYWIKQASEPEKIIASRKTIGANTPTQTNQENIERAKYRLKLIQETLDEIKKSTK
jgi:hypothetical protein